MKVANVEHDMAYTMGMPSSFKLTLVIKVANVEHDMAHTMGMPSSFKLVPRFRIGHAVCAVLSPSRPLSECPPICLAGEPSFQHVCLCMHRMRRLTCCLVQCRW